MVIPGTVGVGYVHGGMVHEPFLRSIMDSWVFDFERMKLISGYFSTGGLYVAVNRNKVVEEFLKKDAEWFWFLDTDIVFDEQTLYRLLKIATDNKCDILSGLYFGRMLSGSRATQPIWLRYSPTTGVFETLDSFEAGKVYEVDVVGMGCCLIHRKVFEAIEADHKANNKDEWIWFGHDTLEKPDGSVTHLGEDVTFCMRARKLGFKVHGTSDVIVGHVKSRTEDLETFAEMTGQQEALKNTVLSSAA